MKDEKINKELEKEIKEHIKKEWKKYIKLMERQEEINFPDVEDLEIMYAGRKEIEERLEWEHNTWFLPNPLVQDNLLYGIFESLYQDEYPECIEKKCDEYGWRYGVYWEGGLYYTMFGNPECKTCQKKLRELAQKFEELFPEEVDYISCVNGIEFYPDFKEEKIYIVKEEEEEE